MSYVIAWLVVGAVGTVLLFALFGEPPRTAREWRDDLVAGAFCGILILLWFAAIACYVACRWAFARTASRTPERVP